MYEVAEQRPGTPRLGNVCEVLAKGSSVPVNQSLKIGGATFSKMDRKGLGDEGTLLDIFIVVS